MLTFLSPSAGEMKSIFRDNAAISKFINECSEEHEPLLQAYAKRILYNTGSKSLGRQLSASNDLVRGALASSSLQHH